MSEQRLGSSFSVPQEMGAQQMERTQLGEDGAATTARRSLAEWILARKRALAAALLVGVAVTTAGCSQEVTGHADAMGGKAAPVVTTPKQTPTTPNAPSAAELFPCEKGGSMGVASTDPHVQNYTGLTDNDIAKLFATSPNDIEQCNGPTLTDTNPVVTSAEFEQISTGDRAVVYVTDTTTSTSPQVDMSYVAYSLATYPVVGNGSLFEIAYSDQYGQRIYQGGDLTIPDEKNPAAIRSYQGAIDRPVSANSNALYEVDAVIFNNPATGDSLTPRITESAFRQQLGEWIDNKVVVLPQGTN